MQFQRREENERLVVNFPSATNDKSNLDYYLIKYCDFLKICQYNPMTIYINIRIKREYIFFTPSKSNEDEDSFVIKRNLKKNLQFVYCIPSLVSRQLSLDPIPDPEVPDDTFHASEGHPRWSSRRRRCCAA